MNARQLHQLEWMQRCAALASSGEGHTPETRRDFRLQLIKQVFLDDARQSRDLFDRIQSDNRPASAAH
jgi:hypothetical protein